MTDATETKALRPDRARHLVRLRREAFDLLVVGGGITGAAVARDAARRGLRTALVEARDFGEGTSSRSSRLIHGGLRYLEHFEFDLVFEASQERRTLLRVAPHLVRPLEFLFPIYRDGRIGRRKLDAGMWLYDALSLFRNIERHQMLETGELLAREPGLRTEGLLGGARYFDAQVDDARLVLMTVLGAVEAGAAVANRVEVEEIHTGDWPGHAATVRDRESGERWRVDALAIVSATGPWTDETLRRAGRPDEDLVRPSRGTHIQVRRERLGHEAALIFESPLDGRIMFVLPWRDLTMIGTTDAFHEGPPEEVRPTPGDVRYLLESTNRLFPDAEIGTADILSAWAGLRPLAAVEGEGGGEGAVSRDFVIREEPEGFFTMVGGKLTSHRAMAETAVDRAVPVVERAGVAGAGKADTARTPLPGGDFADPEELAEEMRGRAADLGVSDEAAGRLARAHGTRAHAVLDLVRERPELAEPVVPGRPHASAEVVHAVRREMALHVEDVAFRRTNLAHEVRSYEPVLRRIAALMAGELGWEEQTVESEVERARAVRAHDDAYLEELMGKRREA